MRKVSLSTLSLSRRGPMKAVLQVRWPAVAGSAGPVRWVRWVRSGTGRVNLVDTGVFLANLPKSHSKISASLFCPF